MNSPANTKGRLHELDALRGIAALTVILLHFSNAYYEGLKDLHVSLFDILTYCTIHVFTAGYEAVMMFFLLSGFVLALPSVSNRPQTYRVFITRRIFRIYFPYLVALAIAVLGNLCWYGPLNMTRWADNTWEHAVQWHAVWQHVLFIGRYDPSQFNTAFWTLIIEMRISILFPLLCFIVLRVKPWISLPAVVFVSIAATYLEMQHNLGLIPGIAGMCHYAGMFVVGILLARYKDRLTKLASSLSRRTGGLCLAGALLLFLFGMASVTLIGRTWFGQPPMWMPAFDLVSLLGAASIIVLSLGFLPLKHLLLTRIPQFLGRVSYSMYLIHSTFLFALLHAVGKKIAGFELLLIYVPSVLLASAVMYRLVEKPLMDLGRKVSTRI